MTEATKAPPGFLFQMTCDVGNGKTILVSGNWPTDVTLDHVNSDIDMFNLAFDRQRAKHEAPLIEERIEGMEQQIASREADLVEFDRQHPKAGGQFAANRVKQVQEITSMKIALTRGQITLAETKLKAE